MRTLIVADDLTGALDVAGPFAQRGIRTEVVVDPGQDWSEALRDAQVVSINADSRHLSATQAAARVVEILDGVDTRGRVLLKKIDSTLRGQVVAETLAMMRATHRQAAVLAPAFPAQGRTVRDGVVYVNGVPLNETAFARDALSPPPAEPLHLAFRQALPPAPSAAVPTCSSVTALDAAALAAPGEHVFVLDAQVNDDLLRAVRSAGDHMDRLLWVGAAGIAQALAAHCYGEGTLSPTPPRAAGRLLVIVGSRALQSRQQVEYLQSGPDVAVFDAPNGCLDLSALLASDATVRVLRAVPGPSGEGDADAVAQALGAAARQLLLRQPLDAVVATGGDTARAILEATGTGVLRVMGDMLPGIPYSRMRQDGRDVWLITKAGGFGAPDTFARIVGDLRGQSPG